MQFSYPGIYLCSPLHFREKTSCQNKKKTIIINFKIRKLGFAADTTKLVAMRGNSLLFMVNILELLLKQKYILKQTFHLP